VGPKRSVLIVAGAWPAAISRLAAASTNPDGPQAKIAGRSRGGQVVSATTAAPMRPYPVTASGAVASGARSPDLYLVTGLAGHPRAGDGR